jgi:transposase
MPQERLSMHKIREVLRLRHLGLSQRAIAQSCAIARSTVGDYVHRAQGCGLAWPLPEDLTDSALRDLLFPDQARSQGLERRPPEWTKVHAELKRKGVTLLLLWQEYRQGEPCGYGYSRFCELYQRWRGSLEPRMRFAHKAGERCFVDYAGVPVSYVNPDTGEIVEAPVFVATLGASDYTYAEAQPDATLPHWIGGHVRAFAFFGGCPEILVPDNLKTGVTNPCWYEPGVNRTYESMANFYSVAVLPTRVRKPRDKAKVEVSVQGIERWVIAPLRDARLVGLGAANQALRERLGAWLDRPMRALGKSRLELFEAIDKPALRPLPNQPFEMENWKRARVAPDYHVAFDSHHYSVPHRLIGQVIEIRSTAAVIEVMHGNLRVASHRRSFVKGGFTTVPDHMPSHHRQHAKWTPERVVRWAAAKGPHVKELVARVMNSRAHPEQGFRSAMGIISLERHGSDRLDSACRFALENNLISYRGVNNVLKNSLDLSDRPASFAERPTPHHKNIRGGQYFE